MNNIRNDTTATYKASTQVACDVKAVTEIALQLLLEEFQRRELHDSVNAFTTPDLVKQYLTLALALEEREHFHVLFLNNQHKLLQDVRLFSGTLDGSAVYPREIVKQALHCNAAAVILAHNHPSGICVPSEADKFITDKVKQALATVDIRTLDHIIVGHLETYSFAEQGAL